MPLKGGYAGKILCADLGRRRCETVPLDEALARKYIGGSGLASKLLFDMIRPGTDPLSPANVLMFAAGPLCGTLFPQASRFTVAAKSPLTEAWGEAHAGGFFGPELKFAGYDAVVVTGRAKKPVYLWIDNEKAEVRDADGVWGRTTFDAIDEVKRRTGEPLMEAAAIGPAGENLVRVAAVLTRNGRVAARAGLGAVMGSKRLKMVAVRGTGFLEVADPENYLPAVREWTDKVLCHPNTEGRIKYGTSELIDLMQTIGRLPAYNMRQGVFDRAEDIASAAYHEKYFLRPRADFACVQRCGRFIEVKDGPYKNIGKGPEYECLSALGSRCGNPRLDSIMFAHHLCDELGMDTIGAGSAIAWAMECFEKGIITAKDTGGLDLSWGNHETICKLVEMTAKREGFGGLLAEGSFRAARKIGKGAEKLVMHAKKADLASQEPRAQKSMGLASAVSPRGADHLYAFPVLDEGEAFGKEIREWYGEKFLPEIGQRLSPKNKGYMVKHNEDYSVLIESLGVCKYGTMVPPALYYPDIAKAIRVTIGWKLSEEEMRRIGERIVNLNRLFNVREGLGRKDDSLPDRLTKEPAPLGVPKGQVCELDQMLDEYYSYRKWNPKTGAPLVSKLKNLGLKEEAAEVLG